MTPVPVQPLDKRGGHNGQLAFHVGHDPAAANVMAEGAQHETNRLARARRGHQQGMGGVGDEDRQPVHNPEE